jgi:hypothetical protein
MDYHKVLVNTSPGRNTINFQGAFPVNKMAKKPGGKIYLSKAEWEWVENAIPHLLGVSWCEEGKEPEQDHPERPKVEVDSKLFEMHHKTAKSLIDDMDQEEIDAYIKHADENELKGAIVNYLIETSNAKSE